MVMSRNAGGLDKAYELIRTIRVGLLTTVDPAGHFHTRPVETLDVDGNGVLWFFTDWNSHKAGEVQQDAHVSLGYADSRRKRYLAVNGRATLLRDARRARELWRPSQRAFYPFGPRDQRLAILRVEMRQAEYWLAPGLVAYLLAAARATLTGTPAGVVGENVRI
jgi:general stress protein 26